MKTRISNERHEFRRLKKDMRGKVENPQKDLRVKGDWRSKAIIEDWLYVLTYRTWHDSITKDGKEIPWEWTEVTVRRERRENMYHLSCNEKALHDKGTFIGQLVANSEEVTVTPSEALWRTTDTPDHCFMEEICKKGWLTYDQLKQIEKDIDARYDAEEAAS